MKKKRRVFTGMSVFLALVFVLSAGRLFLQDANAQVQEGPDVSAQAYCVIDADTGNVVLEKNSEESLAPASITKMMTALLVAENCSDLDARLMFSEAAATGVPVLSSSLSPAGRTNETMSVRDALYGMMLKSANECANALAEYIAGSREEFVRRMNERAKELGCNDTHFETPSGLDAEKHSTTAYDMCLILKAAMENPVVKTVMSAREYTIPQTNAAPARVLTMGHEFINGKQECAGIIAGKTGYTVKAGWTLATAVQREGKMLLTVTLKSGEGQNYNDNRILIQAAFDKIKNKKSDASVTVYSPKVTDMDAEGFTVSWHIGNGGVKAEFPVWTDAGGSEDLTRASAPITDSQIQYRVNIADHKGEMGLYTVQAYVTDAAGEQTVSTVKVLMDGIGGEEGLFHYEGKQYYRKENGAAGLGWIETADDCYYADYNTGILMTGLNQIGGVGYYMDHSGKLQTGWQEINGSTYYFQASSDMAVGWMKIDGEFYYFNQDGKLTTGFLGIEKFKEIQHEVEKIHG